MLKRTHVSSASLPVELGGTQNFKTVWYFIKYHGINNCHGVELTLPMCFYQLCILLQLVPPEMHQEISMLPLFASADFFPHLLLMIQKIASQSSK